MDLETIIEPESRPRRCVVIALDGARFDYLVRHQAPAMLTLVERGVGFRNAIASNGLAETANGFATIATGLTTSGHGIPTSREWYDRELDRLVYVYDEETGLLRLNVPTAAQRIKERYPGLRVASISTKDRLAIILPGATADLVVYSYREHVFHRHRRGSYTGAGVTEDAYVFSERKGKELPDYLRGISAPRRVDWAGAEFSHPDQDAADTSEVDRLVMDGALAILEHERPELLFIGLVALNIVGHKYGPDSPEIAHTLKVADEQIGRLLELEERLGLLDETLFIVTSDHGMTMKPQGIDITTELEQRYGNTLVDNILYTFAGSAGGLYLKDIASDRIQEMVDAVRAVPHVRGAWWKDDPDAPWFIQRMSHPNTADVLIVPERQWVILDPGVKQPNVIAHHGPPYPADVSIIQAFAGPGIRRIGLVGEPLNLDSDELLTEEQVANIPEHRDVAELMLKLFGVT